MSSNPFSSRMPLRQLRAIAAIYSGRVDTAAAPAAYALRGDGAVHFLAFDRDGAVDRFLVDAWVHQVRQAAITRQSVLDYKLKRGA